MYGDGLTILFIAVVVTIIVFLITRELWLWYWKINKIVSLLESIDAKLGMNDSVTGDTTAEMDDVATGKPDAPKEIFDRYREMEDHVLKVRYRDRDQYTPMEQAVIEWEFEQRNLG